MSRSYPRIALLACACLPSLLGMDATAATYVDSQNLVALTVTPTPSAAVGHVAWQFDVAPIDTINEVSSIDAATGAFGFFGATFRQVNPNGLSTVFADFNPFFGNGEDETTDTQFAFVRSNLTVVPASDQEDSTRLEAAFTSFPPIRQSTGATTFAQVVSPIGAAGAFQGAFAVRPVGGGLAQLVEFGPITFELVPGDYNLNGTVDAADYTEWLDALGSTTLLNDSTPGAVDQSDYTIWKKHFGTSTPLLLVSTKVPEPSSIVLFGGLVVMILASCKPLFV